MRAAAFTLVELLVVIAIIAILAALLFPVFGQAKRSSQGVVCISNLRQIGIAVDLYLEDSDDRYPQTRVSDSNPSVDDASGVLDEPSFGAALDLLRPDMGIDPVRIAICPLDLDPKGQICIDENPDYPDAASYLVNASFIFGLNSTQVSSPSDVIYLSERRSQPVDDVPPYCDNVYYPWFNSSNGDAPEDDMDPLNGAIATTRHFNLSNYLFSDDHAKAKPFRATFSPPQLNLHAIR